MLLDEEGRWAKAAERTPSEIRSQRISALLDELSGK